MKIGDKVKINKDKSLIKSGLYVDLSGQICLKNKTNTQTSYIKISSIKIILHL